MHVGEEECLPMDSDAFGEARHSGLARGGALRGESPRTREGRRPDRTTAVVSDQWLVVRGLRRQGGRRHCRVETMVGKVSRVASDGGGKRCGFRIGQDA